MQPGFPACHAPVQTYKSVRCDLASKFAESGGHQCRPQIDLPPLVTAEHSWCQAPPGGAETLRRGGPARFACFLNTTGRRRVPAQFKQLYAALLLLDMECTHMSCTGTEKMPVKAWCLTKGYLKHRSQVISTPNSGTLLRVGHDVRISRKALDSRAEER